MCNIFAFIWLLIPKTRNTHATLNIGCVLVIVGVFIETGLRSRLKWPMRPGKHTHNIYRNYSGGQLFSRNVLGGVASYFQ